MCGRFTLADPRQVASRFSRFALRASVEPSFNVAPTHDVLGVCNDSATDIDVLEWGFISGQPGRSAAQRTVNARAETVMERPMFRDAFQHRRCIVFADGYYEWMTDEKRKRPFYFTIDGGAPFAFAALWHPNLSGGKRFCCLMTTTPNAVQRTVHDRSPVILASDDAIDLWLSSTAPANLLPLLAPIDAGRIAAREVSARVNSVVVNDPLCREAPPEPMTMSLFG
jgi:putative SOS response-associated peptidase YedK